MFAASAGGCSQGTLMDKFRCSSHDLNEAENAMPKIGLS